jgi:hypothetical protein
MPQTLPTQHPATVLRSNYRQLLALLIVAMIAVVGLSTAFILIAEQDDAHRSSLSPVEAPIGPADGPRQVHSPGQRYYVAPDSSREGR